MKSYNLKSLLGISTIAVLVTCGSANAMTMLEAVQRALHTNPEIGQAVANRAGVQFELEQGKGLNLPKVDLQGDIGGEVANNSSSRALGTQDTLFLRREASLVVHQNLYDGDAAKAEIQHQASRVDSASNRVRERSEFIVLSVIHEYLEMERASRIIGLAKENIAYHQKILSLISAASSGGTASIADKQQARERVYAARAKLSESVEDLRVSEATFIKLVGEEPGKIGSNIGVKGKLPASLKAALERARAHHPSVKFAQADVDAASAQVLAAESRFSPKLSLEGRAMIGQDLGGIPGNTRDLQGNLVLNWNLYNGGIDKNNKQEQIRHVDESLQALHKISREVDEGVRQSWVRRNQQAERLTELLRDLSAIDQLRGSYLQEFKIGQRSLLDLLDTQNNRFAVQAAIATSDSAVKFADYRLMASTGDLLKGLNVQPLSDTHTYARKDYDVPPTPAPESFARTEPTPPKS